MTRSSHLREFTRRRSCSLRANRMQLEEGSVKKLASRSAGNLDGNKGERRQKAEEYMDS
ncbi:hypothetical protein KIN20_022784 [Parelaphostrongylus tenuis]|uniref:Uncharacterized protein n=1 Tax=Parelaphostrongylus tenuis TaxID=148309 RepID=A0AAD5MVZ4_PARTN|nr:hypothetical protein KIN20_022784 [Parelaphostrongylus tenuis]